MGGIQVLDIAFGWLVELSGNLRKRKGTRWAYSLDPYASRVVLLAPCRDFVDIVGDLRR